MGVDFYYCGNCQECLHSDCFDCCGICSDKLIDEQGDYICDACHESFIHTLKSIDIEKVKKDFVDDHEIDTKVSIYQGKGKKPKTFKNKVLVCLDCEKKYSKKYKPVLCFKKGCKNEKHDSILNVALCKNHYEELENKIYEFKNTDV